MLTERYHVILHIYKQATCIGLFPPRIVQAMHMHVRTYVAYLHSKYFRILTKALVLKYFAIKNI